MTSRDLIERFVWTYHALLAHRGRRLVLEARCPTAAALAWSPARGVTVDAALAELVRFAGFFTGHPSAPVAWGFVTELDRLERSVVWVLPDRPTRVSTGVPCAERVHGCEGVYEVDAVTMAAEGVAVCSADEGHRRPAKEIG